jgi:GT2 family glycosyltransferase
VAVRSVFIHIVTFNHEGTIAACLSSLLNQDISPFGGSVTILVTDNDSTDATPSVVEQFVERGVVLNRSRVNLGFAAGQNWGIARFLESRAELCVLLNPDVSLEPGAIRELVAGMDRWPDFGAATGLLLRSDENLVPLTPEKIDSAGMIFSSSFRHFDRFACRAPASIELREEPIEGATGAFVAFRRVFIEKVGLAVENNEPLYRVYPGLRAGEGYRYPLFDEAFFAYREDAELSLRAKLLGEKFVFLPLSRGYHQRRVTPAVRSILPAEINKLGVRNRFLLQIAVFSLYHHWWAVFGGLFLRNGLVVVGVLLRERSSISAFCELFTLFPRAIARRRELFRRIRAN